MHSASQAVRHRSSLRQARTIGERDDAGHHGKERRAAKPPRPPKTQESGVTS